MREVPQAITEAWRRGEFIGDTRPMARVTIVHPWVQLHSHKHRDKPGGDMYSTLLFGIPRFTTSGPDYVQPTELPNVKSVSWDRDIDQDVASATFEFYNTAPLPLGETPSQVGDLDRPGWYTYNRGQSAFSSRWGHEENEWAKMLMPDNLLRSYEGYGFDSDQPPEKDPHLILTGLWLIDEVAYTHDGTITCECSDPGRLLRDQIVFPPVNGFRAGFKTKDMPEGAYAYPVSFSSENSEPVVNKVPMNPERMATRHGANSNEPWDAHTVYGHAPEDAFNDDVGSYWLSIGNARRDGSYAFEWIQTPVGGQKVREVRFRTKGVGYKVYLCLQNTNGDWLGGNRVPYNPNHPAAAPNGADTAYVATHHVDSEEEHVISLGEGYDNIANVRLTLNNLWNSGLGQYTYRAAVRTFDVFGGPATRTEETRFEDKNYDDYTDIIKLFCAWGGFFWPILEHHRTVMHSDGSTVAWNYDEEDPALTISRGRVFGDFMQTGTAGVVDLPPSTFDKQPLMDAINHVADIVGFLFYTDETGGAVFRMPNIYALGNWWGANSAKAGERTDTIPRIDERDQLMSITATLSSQNMRERVFVSDTTGQHGGLAAGWNPNPIGLRRVGGWTDQHFASTEECRLMADMITLRQMFTYRTDSVQIPGYPAIQIDDQVRIFERMTSEGFVHYVKGISSSNDLESGEWTYDLKTHWLGERPFERWVFRPEDLSREAQRFLEHLFGEGNAQPLFPRLEVGT